MKKIIMLSLLLVMPIVSGCSSQIAAKYDDFNETFSGTSYYDPAAARAAIKVKSNKNNAICFGNGKMYQYPIWQFNLKCSDGRAITGQLQSTQLEGRAFTNRNETLTFTVSKSSKTIDSKLSSYRSSIAAKPELDATPEKIQVVMP